MTRETTVPLRKRPIDLLFVVFFAINLVFVVYIVDVEQLIIDNTEQFNYPLWPPAPAVDAVHAYGRSLDHLLLARPAFWDMTIWIDILLFGPFYLAAIYAFARSRAWIRVPALVWSGMMASNVLIILMEERYGITPSPNFLLVSLAYLPYLLAPVAMILRMRGAEPFPQQQRARQDEPAGAAR